MDDPLERLIERGLRETQAILAAFPRERRMEYLRLLVEEQPRLAGRSLDERVQHLRVLMQAIDAAADTASDARPDSARRKPSSLR